MPSRHIAGFALLVCCAVVILLPASAPLVTGVVLRDNNPVADCLVRLKGTTTTTRTAKDGRFRLGLSASSAGRVTAWREGHFITGAALAGRPLVLRMHPLPQEDDEAYQWVAPDTGAATHCGTCHGEIHSEWTASAHARAATGRHFHNVYDGTDWYGRPNAGWSLLKEYPDGAGVCTACHAPSVDFADPAYFDLRRVKGVAARGVHCDYCHKVADTAGEPGLTHGRFGLRLLRPAEGQLFFGPLDDVDRDEDAFAPLYRQSRYCAACHEGIVFGVHVYSTYSEWLESPAARAGRQCQDCHMTPTGRLTNIAPGKGGIERDPRTLSSHRMLAGSLADMLRGCLRVTVTLHRHEREVRAEVVVQTENVGHRVPTGFVDRHLILAVEACAEDGSLVAPVEGPRLPVVAGAGPVDTPGRLYAKLLHDGAGRSPTPFWRADPVAIDSRLFPAQADRSVFVFPPTCHRVRVRLVYRRFWPEVAQVKQWGDNEIIVHDTSQLTPAQSARPR